MADEPVDNVGNICIQIFLRIIRVISMKKIFLNGKMEDNLKEIDNKIYIVWVYTKNLNRKRNQDNYFPPFQINKDKSSSDKNVTWD